jgi:dihydrofolate reductase
MAIDLYWDDDNLTTLLCIFDGRWTWNDLHATMKTIKQITDDLPHEVSAIIDVRKGAHLPEGMFSVQSLERAKQLVELGEGGTGQILVVGANPIIRTIFEAVSRLDRNAVTNVQFVESIKQAREYLLKRRTA